jgi:hypothetical protein
LSILFFSNVNYINKLTANISTFQCINADDVNDQKALENAEGKSAVQSDILVINYDEDDEDDDDDAYWRSLSREIGEQIEPNSTFMPSPATNGFSQKSRANQDKALKSSIEKQIVVVSETTNKSSFEKHGDALVKPSLMTAPLIFGTRSPISTMTTKLSSTCIEFPSHSSHQNGLGDGVYLKDEEIVNLLRQPPKSVPQLRTRTAFQNYFKGMKTTRMRFLLEEAYDTPNLSKKEMDENIARINKRMELLKDVLT